jgi:hypothetical protein
MAQAVEHLLCKHEALSSNPNLTKNEQKGEVATLAGEINVYLKE